MQKLSEEAISQWLSEHAAWKRQGDVIQKTFGFADYPSTIAFVTRVAFAAEKRNHHPDMLVSYQKVEVYLTTHDAQGLTSRDLDLATECDRVARA